MYKTSFSVCKTSISNIGMTFPKILENFFISDTMKNELNVKEWQMLTPCPKFGVLLVYLEFDKLTMGKNQQK